MSTANKRNQSNVIAVTGATGQIGQTLTKLLIAAGVEEVRIVSRDATKAQELVALGAKAFIGQGDDVALMTKAFTGADAVFALTPPIYSAPDYRAAQNVSGGAIAAALVAAKVNYVVNLSSVGAHLGDGTGVIDGLADQEKRLNAIAGLNVVHLRPASFMENLAFTIEPIRSMGVVGTPLDGAAKGPMIATADIATKAAELLRERGFTGKQALELLGERDISMADVTAALQKALGRPELKYVQFSYEAAKSAMISMGFSEDAAERMIIMYRAANSGYLRPEKARTAASTTATSIESFAAGFAKLV